MAKIAVKYFPVAEIGRALKMLVIARDYLVKDAHRIEANMIRQDLRNLAAFMPKFLYESKGKFVPQTARVPSAELVTRPEKIRCATVLRETSKWMLDHVSDVSPGYTSDMCKIACNLEIIAAYLPETIDPLHWPLMQQAPNPNGEIRVSNLSGLL